MMASSIVYGPVPSRRLGRSLGINNIPPKICSYSCVYCQLGDTLRLEAEPRPFYKPARIVEEARNRLTEAGEKNVRVDYVAFVPDGEPTLDANLGEEIHALKALGARVAVITNGSLLWREEVRANLLRADWVSLKVDAVTDAVFSAVNKPGRLPDMGVIMQGMVEFSRTFEGELATETMMVRDINDSPDEAEKIADFLAVLKPTHAYIAVPIRPPAERCEPAGEESTNIAYQIFKERLHRVEYLVDYEGNDFASTGRIQEDILAITSVHPMREDAVRELLEKSGAAWTAIQRLIDNGDLVELSYRGERFYARRLPGRRATP